MSGSIAEEAVAMAGMLEKCILCCAFIGETVSW